MPGEKYESRKIDDWNPEAFNSKVEIPYLVVSGRCPRCNEDTVYHRPIITIDALREVTKEQYERIFRALREAGAEPDTIEFTMSCRCSGEHPGRPEGKAGCGAYWVVEADMGAHL
jgi:hypothetical protein